MDDSGGILCQISSLKDMLDQVNEEIEENIQITRYIESEIVKCSKVESALTDRESELTKTAYLLQFDIEGLMSVTAGFTNSVKLLEDEVCQLRMKQDEIKRRMNSKCEEFMGKCLNFQKDISKGENDEVWTLLKEREFLENEVHTVNKKNSALQNSMLAFVEDVLGDLQGSSAALHAEICSRKLENEKLLKDIDELKATLLSAISIG